MKWNVLAVNGTSFGLVTRTWTVACALLMVMSRCVLAQQPLSWTVTADMGIGRHSFDIAKLDAHRVLIIGGAVSTGSTASVQIYDARTKTVTDAAPLPHKRCCTASLTLPDGRILVSGGRSSGFDGTQTIWQYTPAANSWSGAGGLYSIRQHHSMVMADDDHIVIIGGGGTSTEVYTISTGTSRPSTGFGATTASGVFLKIDGGLYYFGHRESFPVDGDRSDRVSQFFLSKDYWDVAGRMTAPVCDVAVTELSSGTVLISGGSLADTKTSNAVFGDVQEFRNGSFVKIGELLNHRSSHQSVEYAPGKVIVMGGVGKDYVPRFRSCEIIDAATGRVEPGPPMNEDRRYFRATTLLDAAGKTVVVAIGGQRAGAISSTIEELELCELCPRVPLTPPHVEYAGGAREDAGVAQLTDTVQRTAGQMWITNRIPVAGGFDIEFAFRLRRGNDRGVPDGDSAGADGIAFVLQQQRSAASGSTSGGIGYDGMPHGLAIEFDAYKNSSNEDPNGAHVAIQVGNGLVLRASHTAPHLLAIASENVPPFVADGRPYFARVTYVGKQLSVYLSDQPVFTTPILTVDDIDLRESLNLDTDDSCYAVFTASTGASSQMHELLSVDVKGQVVSSVEEDTAPIAPHRVSLSVTPTPVQSVAVVRLSAEVRAETPVLVVTTHGVVVLRTSIERGQSSCTLQDLDVLPSGLYRVIVREGATPLSAPLIITR